MNTDKIYTVQTLSQLLDISKPTLRTLASTKKIKAYKKLRKWYFLHSDVIAYLKS